MLTKTVNICNMYFQVFKMVRMNVLADALNAISTAGKRGRRQVLLRSSSKVIVTFLSAMMKHGYTGEFEQTDGHRSVKIVVSLTGRWNRCGIVSPRFDVSRRDSHPDSLVSLSHNI